MALREEVEVQDWYGVRYEEATDPAIIAVEREVLGADYGGSGYTTRDQADRLAAALDLGRGADLLDVGCGCGWPGVYLAATTGCRVVLTDITEEGVRQGRRRATRDGLARSVDVVVSSARHLPFRPESFDAIVHTDVLC